MLPCDRDKKLTDLAISAGPIDSNKIPWYNEVDIFKNVITEKKKKKNVITGSSESWKRIHKLDLSLINDLV